MRNNFTGENNLITINNSDYSPECLYDKVDKPSNSIINMNKDKQIN